MAFGLTVGVGAGVVLPAAAADVDVLLDELAADVAGLLAVAALAVAEGVPAALVLAALVLATLAAGVTADEAVAAEVVDAGTGAAEVTVVNAAVD